MRNHFLLAASFAVLAACAAPARSGVPSPANSIIPNHICLVGADASGHPDSVGTFRVVYRDLANNPVPGVHVFVDFSLAPDLRLCAAQGAGVALMNGGAEGITDLTGTVTMTLLGHGVPHTPASVPQSVKIYADGVMLGSVSGSAYDLDGLSGVSGADLALWLTDFVSGTNPARSNYNADGYVGGADLALWAAVFVRGGSAQSCPAVITAPN